MAGAGRCFHPQLGRQVPWRGVVIRDWGKGCLGCPLDVCGGVSWQWATWPGLGTQEEE